MQQRVLHDPDITVMYTSTVTEIKGDGQHVTSVIITNQVSGETQELPTDAVFIAVGLTPNTAPFKDHVTCNAGGFIQVSDNVKTSVEGVFAAGDVHDYRYRQAITSAAAGCMAALDAERYLSEHE